ncbi:MAG: hypothetical protein ACLQBA_05670 [Candidatus Binataceae bacterium]
MISPLYLFHCDRCKNPLLIAAVWEDQEQLIGELPGVKALEQLGATTKIKTVVALLTPDPHSDPQAEGVPIIRARVYEPPRTKPYTFDEREFYSHLAAIEDKHKDDCQH